MNQAVRLCLNSDSDSESDPQVGLFSWNLVRTAVLVTSKSEPRSSSPASRKNHARRTPNPDARDLTNIHLEARGSRRHLASKQRQFRAPARFALQTRRYLPASWPCCWPKRYQSYCQLVKWARPGCKVGETRLRRIHMMGVCCPHILEGGMLSAPHPTLLIVMGPTTLWPLTRLVLKIFEDTKPDLTNWSQHFSSVSHNTLNATST